MAEGGDFFPDNGIGVVSDGTDAAECSFMSFAMTTLTSHRVRKLGKVCGDLALDIKVF